MGSFAFTCCVSGLPIEVGDEVRYFLLTENKYGELACYVHDHWNPRTWPIKAKYNDYGSIEDWEEGPLVDAIIEGFRLDLIEKGTGSNQYHDVPIRKKMTFKNVLDAVKEDRLTVDSEAPERESKRQMKEWYESHGLAKDRERPTPPWYPTLQNVERLLGSSVENYCVDEKGDSIRVRIAGYGKDTILEEAQKLLEKDFLTIIVAGEVNSSGRELRCFMKPGRDEQGYDRYYYKRPEGKELRIKQAMIREDVWQALLKIPIESWYYKDNSIEAYRKSVCEFIEKSKLRPKTFIDDLELESSGRETLGCELLAKDKLPYDNGLASHAKLLKASGNWNDEFAILVAEFTYIWDVLGTIRCMWRPSTSCGPQFGEWQTHETYSLAMAEIAKQNKRIPEEEDEE